MRNEAGFGLLDYHARYYSPVLGRFVSADTIVPEPGKAPAFDRYAYVYNNPLRYSDPSGYFSEEQITTYLQEHYPEYWEEYLEAWQSDPVFWDMLEQADYGDTLSSWHTSLGKGTFTRADTTFGFRHEQGVKLRSYQGFGPYTLKQGGEVKLGYDDQVTTHPADHLTGVIQTGMNYKSGGGGWLQPIYSYSDDAPPQYTGFVHRAIYRQSNTTFNLNASTGLPNALAPIIFTLIEAPAFVLKSTTLGAVGFAYGALETVRWANNATEIGFALKVDTVAKPKGDEGECSLLGGCPLAPPIYR